MLIRQIYRFMVRFVITSSGAEKEREREDVCEYSIAVCIL